MKDYCISIDVAKNKSFIGLFAKDGEVLIKPHEVKHTRTDLNLLLKEVKKLTKICDVAAIMESTNIYHRVIECFFKSNGIETIVYNPLISAIKKNNIRKTKTDKIDCINIANIYFDNLFNKQYIESNLFIELQSLNRFIYDKQEEITRNKNRFKDLLNQIFPGFEELCSSCIYSETNLHFLATINHPEEIKAKRVDYLANLLGSLANRHPNYYRIKAEKTKECAKNSLYSVTQKSFLCFELKNICKTLLNQIHEINALKEMLISASSQIPFFEMYKSFLGISDFTAAELCAELKDLKRFSNYKQLIASCGFDPTIIQSGKSINYHGPISKRGNKYARKILFYAATTIINAERSSGTSSEFYNYYQKKRNEGKHHYAAIVACSTKLLRKIYYRSLEVI